MFAVGAGPIARIGRRSSDSHQYGTYGPQAPPQSVAASAFSIAVVSCICAILLAARICWYC